jgi:plastocyanin
VPRVSTWSLLLSVLLAAAACDEVPLIAPSESTVTLSVSTTTLGANGSAELVAVVIEPAGTPVHDGTEVTFQASVGRVDPVSARTENGVARSVFHANGASGTARIVAFSGGARSEAAEIRVGSAAAETVTVRVNPSSVPQTGGTVQISALVRDASGNPVQGAQVAFSADNGVLSANSAITGPNGEATTTLQTSRQTIVRATVAGKEGQATVNVVSVPSASIQVNPQTPTAGQPVTITITPSTGTNANPIQNVIVELGDGTRHNLGAIAGATQVAHIYSQQGSYTISVTVVDNEGRSSTASAVVVVQRPTLALSFMMAPASGRVGTPVTFTVAVANSTGVPISGITLNFGDGTSALLGPSGGSTQHTYTSAGTYTVRATATDSAGVLYQTTHVIQIQP